MKKILTLILSAAALLFVVSCSNSKTNSNGDSCCNDSAKCTEKTTACTDGNQMVCGVAFDGAMNSIFLRTAKGDTVSFGYAELEPSKRVSWMIGDTVKIKYTKTSANNDSVIQMYKGCITDCNK